MIKADSHGLDMGTEEAEETGVVTLTLTSFLLQVEMATQVAQWLYFQFHGDSSFEVTLLLCGPSFSAITPLSPSMMLNQVILLERDVESL